LRLELGSGRELRAQAVIRDLYAAGNGISVQQQSYCRWSHSGLINRLTENDCHDHIERNVGPALRRIRAHHRRGLATRDFHAHYCRSASVDCQREHYHVVALRLDANGIEAAILDQGSR
jgi:hypothetical protein